MKISDLMGWAMVILSAAVVVLVMHRNTEIAGRYEVCELRGGVMYRVNGELQCVGARK